MVFDNRAVDWIEAPLGNLAGIIDGSTSTGTVIWRTRWTLVQQCELYYHSAGLFGNTREDKLVVASSSQLITGTGALAMLVDTGCPDCNLRNVLYGTR